MSYPSSAPGPHVSSTQLDSAADAPSHDASPPERSWVRLALVGGHLGAAVYVLICVLSLVAFGSALSDGVEDRFARGGPIDMVGLGILAAVSFVFALLSEVVTIGLHRRRKWAWFAGLVMFGFYLFSPLFLVVGALGMCGLLRRGSRREFGLVGATDGRRQDAAPNYPVSIPSPDALSPKPERPPEVHSDDVPPPAKSRVWLALVGGHLGAAFHVLFAIGALAVACLFVADVSDDDGAAVGVLVFGWFALFSLALAIVVEVVTIGMHRRRPWAWFAGFAMFVLYLAFLLPIGAIGLCGLLTEGSRREFGMG
jgi:hypothetical protein